jgi:benzoyl-CoA reductase/2-hydroxyglutaryl-CoA dehydratase subunit BcrC/BadD/HgdB
MNTMLEETRAPDPEEEKRKFRAVKKMRDIMTRYFIEAKTAKQNDRMVAWITSGGPVEPLIAMDIIPVYPENHGAMIGASHLGVGLCETAEQMGYSRDLCSYARTDIASAATGTGAIPGGLPRPDFLVCCNNICGTVVKWYEVLARHFNVPLFIYDTPFIHTDFSEEAKKYVREQTAEYLSFLETMTGRKIDYDRLAEVARLSIKAMRLWQKVLETGMHKPAPMTAFDAFFHLALIVTLRGQQVVIDYYTELLDELNEHIAQGIGMVSDEKYRLLWDNLPLWFKTRWLSDKFAAHGAALVGSTYTNAWCSVVDLIDENDLVGSLGIASSSIYINISIDRMLGELGEMIRKFDVDGLVMHSNRSCKPYSLGQYDIQKMVMKEFGIPSLIIEADQVDERNFSESQIETRIDAFMETIKARRK